MIQDCLFCRFVRKEISPRIVFEDEETLAFYDIQPQAPIHIVLIPKKHVDSVSEIEEGDPIVSILTNRAVKIADKLGVAKDGFRLITNSGVNGGQAIPHLHMHLLGGRELQWPPG